MTLYLHETIDIILAGARPYLQSVGEELAPRSKANHGSELVGAWQTIGSTGRWPEVVVLWTRDDWNHVAEILEKQFSRAWVDEGLEDWWKKVCQWRSGGFDRVLEPTSYSPPAEDLLSGKVRGAVFLHVLARAQPAKVAEYLEAVGEQFRPIAEKKGMQLVGAYKVALRGSEALHIWAVKDWKTFARIQEERRGDPDLVRWQERARSLLNDWEAKLLWPSPWSPLR